MTAPVFLLDPPRLAELCVGSTLLLDGAEGRHAGLSQRRHVGDRVDVVDGAGTRLLCSVARAEGPQLDLTVVERHHERRPSVRLTLVQALAKGDRDELAVEAATEVGVDGVVPWQAERSVVVWRGDRIAKNQWRWQALIRAATKQSRRAWLPELDHVHDSAALARRITTLTQAGGLAVVLHEAATATLASIALPAAPAQHPSDDADGQAVEIVVVVGPEGGIAERELDAFTAAGALPVRLGPTVLRTSTAGPVALGILAYRLGRWG